MGWLRSRLPGFRNCQRRGWRGYSIQKYEPASRHPICMSPALSVCRVWSGSWGRRAAWERLLGSRWSTSQLHYRNSKTGWPYVASKSSSCCSNARNATSTAVYMQMPKTCSSLDSISASTRGRTDSTRPDCHQQDNNTWKHKTQTNISHLFGCSQLLSPGNKSQSVGTSDRDGGCVLPMTICKSR